MKLQEGGGGWSLVTVIFNGHMVYNNMIIDFIFKQGGFLDNMSGILSSSAR